MAAAPQWFVQVQDRLYGPYGLEQMRAFAAQNRLGRQTMTSRTRQGPFACAADDPALAGLFPDMPGASPGQEQITAQRQLVVMAAVSEDSFPAFMQSLSGFGTAIEVFKNFWLLKAPFTAEQVRNALSRDLSKQDAVFIADASHGASSWFNVGQTLDARIRQFWLQQP